MIGGSSVKGNNFAAGGPVASACLFLLLLVVTGCSSSVGSPQKGSTNSTAVNSGDVSAPADLTGASQEEKEEWGREPPVDVEVGQLFVRDNTLNVKVYLRAKTDVPTDSVVVTLLGFSEGQQLTEQSVALSDLHKQPVIETGRSVLAHFTVPAAGLSDFQVKCSWGAEGRDILARVQAPSPVNSAVTLDQITLEKRELPCVAGSCEQSYTVKGRLFNSSPTPVDGIELALGIFFVPEGETFVSPTAGSALTEQEEQISLPELSLPSGGEQKIRIEVDRPIPVVEGGQLLPNLRLLSYSNL